MLWFGSISHFMKKGILLLKPQRLLVDFVRAKWYIYVSGIMFTGSANMIQSYFPHLLGQFTDQLQADALTQSAVINYSVMLLGVGVSYGLLGGIGQFHIMYVGRLFEFFTRKRLFDHFTALSEHFYSKYGVGKLLSYVMNDVTAVRESISMGVNQTANAIFLLLSAVTMMLFSSIPLYLIGACVVPLLFIPWIVVRFGPVIRKRSLQVQESLGTMTESAEEQFGGIRVTKKFAVETIMNGRFGRTVDQIRDNQLKLVRVSSVFQSLIPFLGALSLVITIVFGGYLVLHLKLSLGNFVALTLYIRMMVNPLQQIGNVINTMQRSRASLERLNDLFAMKPDIEEIEQSTELDFHQSAIRITDLSFSYPDAKQEALHHIHLTIEPGKTIGIVGKTGSGKTTLVKLLLRLYDSPQGSIRIGDVDIRDLSLESLRGGIAYVPQDGFLFSTTIRENIAFFRRTASLDQVEKAPSRRKFTAILLSFPISSIRSLVNGALPYPGDKDSGPA